MRKNDYNLAPVLSTILRSNVFFSGRAYRALVKSPAEFVVGTYKTLGMTQMQAGVQRSMTAMGQILFYPPNVSGWPGGQNWITSQMLLARENFVSQLTASQGTMQSGWFDDVPTDAHKAAQQLVGTILQGDASPNATAQVVDYLNGTGESALGTFSVENRDIRLRGGAYLTMAMPAFQLA